MSELQPLVRLLLVSAGVMGLSHTLAREKKKATQAEIDEQDRPALQ